MKIDTVSAYRIIFTMVEDKAPETDFYQLNSLICTTEGSLFRIHPSDKYKGRCVYLDPGSLLGSILPSQYEFNTKAVASRAVALWNKEITSALKTLDTLEHRDPDGIVVLR